MKLIAFLVVLGALGCGLQPAGHTGPVQGEKEAVEIAWEYYGRSDTPPVVYYVTGADLDCFDGAGFHYEDFGCVQGFTPDEGDWTSIAWPTGQKFSDSALAHELRHVVAMRTTGNRYGASSGDPLMLEKARHDALEGWIWGEPAGQVGQAMDLTAAAGL
jgi:hypothetical protein